MDIEIIDVWRDNLEYEMARLRKVIIKYPFVSMDTEFPGVVARPLGIFGTSSNFIYQQLRCNIDLLNIIQLGLTFSNLSGEIYPLIYQFNFVFDIEKDMYSQESIDLLHKAKINFDKHKSHGIIKDDFGELIVTSGIVMSPQVSFLSFHSSYDFGYLMKIILNNPLPKNENDFFMYLTALFPNFYDIKLMLQGTSMFKKGLQEIADELGVERIGIQHQAGSDSFLTCLTYWKIREKMFKEPSELVKFKNKLFGIELRK